MPNFDAIREAILHSQATKYLIGAVIVLLTIGGYYVWQRSTATANQDAVVTAEVTRGDIRSTVKVVGKAELANEQKLRFNQVGKVAAVYVREGDSVKKDQLIAALDDTDARNSIEQAQTSLANAKLNLQDLLNGSTKSQLLSSRNAVSDTKQKIAVAETEVTLAKKTESATSSDVDRQLSLAKLDLANKQKAVDIAEKDFQDFKAAQNGASSTSANNTYAATVSDGIIKGKSAIAQVDSILDNLNTVLALDSGTEAINDEFENNLGALNSNTLLTADSSFAIARSEQKNAIALASSLNTTTASAAAVLVYLQTIQDALTATIQAADDTYTLLSNSVSSTNFTQTKLDNLKSGVVSNRGSGQSQLTTINSTITKINDLNDPNSKENSYKTALYALQQAQSTLKNLEATIDTKKSNATLDRVQAENDLKSLKNTLAQQEAALKDVERGSTAESIATARNNVTLRELDLEKARKTLETKYQITAPFDGIVSSIDFKVGDNLIADDSKYVYIQNPDLVKLSISLDQIDVVKVKVGQAVEVVFDALPTQTFKGSIETIDPAPVESSGVVSYNAKITIDRGKTHIFSGMTATAQIVIAEVKDVIAVSSAALSSMGDQTFVRRMVNGKPQRTVVTTGITDGKKTEIKTGLTLGDTIIISGSTMNRRTSNGEAGTTSGSTQSQDQQLRQIFRATGSGGGSGPAGGFGGGR